MMTRAMSLRKAWWWAAAAALVSGGLWLALAGRAAADPATVTVGSASGAPGTSVTVNITVTPGAGETVGALTLQVTYDATRLSVTGCNPAATCNPNWGPNTVRLALANPAGLSGVVGNISFDILPNAPAGTATLDGTAVTCADIEGRALTCTVQDGAVTVEVPQTPTPSPTPTPRPSPTPTPRVPPPTGGEPMSSGGSPWVFGLGIGMAAAGVALVGWRLRRAVS